MKHRAQQSYVESHPTPYQQLSRTGRWRYRPELESGRRHQLRGWEMSRAKTDRPCVSQGRHAFTSCLCTISEGQRLQWQGWKIKMKANIDHSATSFYLKQTWEKPYWMMPSSFLTPIIAADVVAQSNRLKHRRATRANAWAIPAMIQEL